MENPVLTVVMPVYNGEKYLKEAIDSVLKQTFSNFELLIINDGSIDESLNIIQAYKDDRIHLINNKVNMGIPYCRNLGLESARGEYLAWTDCDDVNELSRFEEQINFLNDNKEFGICGTKMIRFGKKRSISKIYDNPEIIKATLLFKPSVPNASAMFRLSKIREFNLKYDNRLKIAQDYDFVLRCSMLFPITNLQKALYLYRDSETSITKKYASQPTDHYNIHKIVYEKALGFLGIAPSDAEIKIHRAISSIELFDNTTDYIACYNWLKVLKYKNAEVKLYRECVFNKVLADQFYFISKKASRFGMATLVFYLKKSYTDFDIVSFNDIIKLVIRCTIRYNKF